jgi:hypothetical protein
MARSSDSSVAGSSAESESASDAESERASEGADAMPEMLYNAARDGRVWCVQVDHPDHLIVAQRAYRRAPGAIVTKASRPIIVGNCIGKNLAMIEIKIIFTLLFQRFNLSLVPGQHIAANAITRLPKNGIKFRIKRRTEAMALPLDEQELKAEAALRQRAVLKPLGMI